MKNTVVSTITEVDPTEYSGYSWVAITADARRHTFVSFFETLEEALTNEENLLRHFARKASR